MSAKQMGLLGACGISIALTAACGWTGQDDGYAIFFGLMSAVSLFMYVVDE